MILPTALDILCSYSVAESLKHNILDYLNSSSKKLDILGHLNLSFKKLDMTRKQTNTFHKKVDAKFTSQHTSLPLNKMTVEL